MQSPRAVGWVLWSAVLVAASGPAFAQQEQEEGRTIAQWVADLSGNFSKRQKATAALVKIGKAAVKPVLAEIESRGKGAGQAFETLAKMGESAREALPVLMEIAKDDAWGEPPVWTWSSSPRLKVLMALREASWAADELVPFFLTIAENASETDRIRRAAVAGLGGMGEKAEAATLKLTRVKNDALREQAHHARIRALSVDPKTYFAEVLDENPFDPNAPSYLGRTKGIYNSGRMHPLTERVKKALRERLATSPDPELSWTLATIIQDQLRGNSIQWAAPSDSVASRTDRENPKESFATLEEAALLGFRSAKKGSDRWRQFGVGLAKLYLLRGDWASMNRQLEKLGWAPIPQERRPTLAAPPHEWNEKLAESWAEADESMRSGDCGLVLRFEKDGKALQGIHVLIKTAPEQKIFSTGIAADTLFLAPYPFHRFMGSFGYRAGDRGKTRYAVSDSSGVVRFEKLPLIQVKLEVLVPTANFSEAGAAWELWAKTAEGKFRQVSAAPIPGAITPRSPEAQPKLVAGKTVEYPPLFVRPRIDLNVGDWTRVDKDSFVVSWNRASSQATDYVVEMSLSAPQQDPGWLPKIPFLETRTEIVSGTSWQVGKRGVGGLTLEPGNFYVLRVRARDDQGEILSQSKQTRLWVPWEHRTTEAPTSSRDTDKRPPIYEGIWWRTSVSGVRLRPRIDGYLESNRSAFEREYVQVGDAWIDWRDGNTAGTRKKLAELLEKLPERNAARATAQWLTDRINAGAACPKRLNFQSFPIDGKERDKK